jgi:hypothetical protein
LPRSGEASPVARAGIAAAAVQGTGSAGLIALTDNNLPPASGRAKLRLVNASSDTTAYDAYVNFAKLLSGLAQETASAYRQFDAGTYTVTSVRRVRRLRQRP